MALAMTPFRSAMLANVPSMAKSQLRDLLSTFGNVSSVDVRVEGRRPQRAGVTLYPPPTKRISTS